MTTFIWLDGRGNRLHLDEPTAIEAEIETINVALDRLAGDMENADSVRRNAARATVRGYEARLGQLEADLKRWNVHATALIRAAAGEAVAQIAALPSTIVSVALVVALHDEHDDLIARTTGLPNTRMAALTAPVTDVQRLAMETCGDDGAPVVSTRGDAQTWLAAQPRFARHANADNGWFAWIDRHGHAHRLVDPLMIEREVVLIASKLQRLAPRLNAAVPAEKVGEALHEWRASLERLQNLQYDLTRFDREEDARDLAACKQWAADWRSRRCGRI